MYRDENRHDESVSGHRISNIVKNYLIFVKVLF